MPRLTISNARIRQGVWEGVLLAPEGSDDAPLIEVVHLGKIIEDFELVADTELVNLWTLRVPIPRDLLSDGVQTFLIRDMASDEILERFTIIMGQPLEEDLRTELDLLRQELDLLKKAFRRHCSEMSRN